MYVRDIVDGKEVLAMIDTGETRNFVADGMVGHLGLQVKEHSSRIKAVNLRAQQVSVIAYGVQIKLGDWAE